LAVSVGDITFIGPFDKTAGIGRSVVGFGVETLDR
jgi:hypothetical protein